MENRYQDFYEGSTHKKLKHILDSVIYTLRPYGEYDGLVQFSIETNKNIAWDQFKSINMKNLANFLENAVGILLKTENEIKTSDFEKIKQLIEPLEIVITEIKMAYVE